MLLSGPRLAPTSVWRFGLSRLVDSFDRVVAATTRSVRSTRGALPALPLVGFPESPPEPAVRLVDATGSPQVPLWGQ
jgi:hypothetical protein